MMPPNLGLSDIERCALRAKRSAKRCAGLILLCVIVVGAIEKFL